jgi:mono/diheme cytochrome c family protein
MPTDDKENGMNWWTTTGLAVLAAGSFAVAACGGDNAAPPSKRGQKENMATIYRPPVPEEYKGITPPEGMDLNDPAVIAAGKAHFNNVMTANCSGCHGDKGKGDGAAGKALDPKPRDLTDPAFQDVVANDYLFFRIKSGSTGYKDPSGKVSAMTGFPTAKSDEEIWQVVAYVRSLKGT